MSKDVRILQAIRSQCRQDFENATQCGGNVNATTHDGRSALELAMQHGSAAIGRRLLELDAERDQTVNTWGDTLLVEAARTDNLGFATCLSSIYLSDSLRKQGTFGHAKTSRCTECPCTIRIACISYFT